jgi:hypothetical protein
VNKTSTRTPLQDDKVRFRVVLEGEAYTKGSQESRVDQFRLLKMIAEDPSLTACGMGDFHKLTMTHNGTRWIVEAEAVVDARTDT